MKKTVIAYLHTHWDREWYREFEIFRLRLLRVFDEVLDLLEEEKIPSFYFDGQTCALEDYLQLRPEKESIIRKFILQKKLFIGPCYTLVDEFLTDEYCFEKNLEIGLKYSKDFGCEDFLGYFADTFGHSQAIPLILKKYGIDKAIVWRGVPNNLPSEFIFNGVKTVDLVRGYFNDIFSADVPLQDKAMFLKSNLDKIAEKSTDTLLLPIGADHLGVPIDINEQIEAVNGALEDYDIVLSSPFEYFERVKDNFKIEYNDELRDNSKTFILQGCYSARADIKKYSAKASEKLHIAQKLSKKFGDKYKTAIEYAYKLMLKNLAHDGICGCSTDDVHSENITRYKKVLQIADTIIREIQFENGTELVDFSEFETKDKKDYEVVSQKIGVEDDILYDTQKIPITEDFKPIYTCIKDSIEEKIGSLNADDNSIQNNKIALFVKNGKITVVDKVKNIEYTDFLKIIDFKDMGDTYNFAPDVNDKGKSAKVLSSKLLRYGHVQSAILIVAELGREKFKIEVSLNRNSDYLKFKIKWNNLHKNHLLQVRFNLKNLIKKTYYQMMGYLFERNFDCEYDIRKNLPKTRGLEAKTNTAPFQKNLYVEGINFRTEGIFEYEVYQNQLSLTILRAIGIISNPKNPARTTPAGPPIKVPCAQLLGLNEVIFEIGFKDIN
ncbi:MAG: hypothetical protein DKM22_06985 [Candidatus Melainabacteria bacterium]|nr:MAG: hypothetical protein DKM22_06985 [Candidatus Melainabacteria bacterium]